MNIIVTGGAGFIGSHVVLSLLDSGFTPIVVDNLSTGLRQRIPSDVRFYEIDIRDVKRMTKLVEKYNVAAAIHLAASISLPESYRDPIAFYDNNISSTLSLMKSISSLRPTPIVFSSTAAVYGPTADMIAETHCLRPQSPYGRSKLACENIVMDGCKANRTSCAVLRYFNVAGADPLLRSGRISSTDASLFSRVVSVATGAAEAVYVYGDDYETHDGTCIRDFLHVSDLADAHIHALDYLMQGNESIVANCGYGVGISVMQVIDEMRRQSGVDFSHIVCPRRPGDLQSVVAKTDFIRDTLKWEPKHASLHDMVLHTLSWERHSKSMGESQ